MTALAILAACDDQRMLDQPKYEAYERAPAFPGGQVMLAPPEGTNISAATDTAGEARCPGSPHVAPA